MESANVLEKVRNNGVMASAYWHDVHIGNYRKAVTAADVLAGVEDFERLVRAGRGGPPWGSFMIAEPDIPLPDLDIRHVATEGMKRVSVHQPAQAVVLLGEGFWVSAARSLVTAMRMILPNHHSMRVFGEVEEAARWMVEALGRPPSDALTLARMAEEVRAWTELTPPPS
jgi:hypothetical protein